MAIEIVLTIVIVLTIARMSLLVCPSDKLVCVTNRIKGKIKCHHGGATIRVPIIHHVSYVDLAPLTLALDERGVTKDGEPIKIFADATFAPSTHPEARQNVVIRLMDLSADDIKTLASEILTKNIKSVLKQFALKSIQAEDSTLVKTFERGVEREFGELGLVLLKFKITNVESVG